MMKKTLSAAAVALMLSMNAGATAILSPTAIIQNTLGDRDGFVDSGNIINGSGLATGFTSGVTDFDTYLSGSPSHTLVAVDNEWFASNAVTSGFLDFDLGADYTLDRVAIWNEDAAGVSRLEILTSLDSSFAVSTSHGFFSLTNNTRDVDYLADVLGLGGPVSARYVRFSILGAYSDEQGAANQASLGEVAFSVVTTDVPEPGTVGLMGLGLVGLGLRRRARKS